MTALLGALVIASLAGGSSPFKRYTLPTGPAGRIVPRGTMTVELPSEWRLTSTVWTWRRTGNRVDARIPTGEDPVHTGVRWVPGVDLEETGTTLAEIRARSSFTGWRDIWGPNSGVRRQVGDVYVTLPMGKAWRQTVLWVPPAKNGGWAARSYTREYWLDRGIGRNVVSGKERQLFEVFSVSCDPAECRTHNGQLAAIMRSIRITD